MGTDLSKDMNRDGDEDINIDLGKELAVDDTIGRF
jgi:hypothetical protein